MKKTWKKIAFLTQKENIEFNQMPFGLTNEAVTFQRLIECILAGIIDNECLIYIDDIIMFSQSFEENLQRLRHVFQRLQTACLN